MGEPRSKTLCLTSCCTCYFGRRTKQPNDREEASLLHYTVQLRSSLLLSSPHLGSGRRARSTTWKKWRSLLLPSTIATRCLLFSCRVEESSCSLFILSLLYQLFPIIHLLFFFFLFSPPLPPFLPFKQKSSNSNKKGPFLQQADYKKKALVSFFKSLIHQSRLFRAATAAT